MTTVQLKTEINKILDEVPEGVLPGVLKLLKELKQKPEDDTQLADFLKQTLIEDRALLEKLAK